MHYGSENFCRRDAPGTMEVAFADTRARAAAIRLGPGIHASTRLSAEVEALRQHATGAGLPSCFEPLSRRPEAFGFEHEVWFMPHRDEPWVLKATYPDAFGHLPDGRACFPTEYFERLLLQNEVFGDDIRLEGIAIEIGTCRVITSQPAVAGRFAEPEEVDRFFLDRGFSEIKLKVRKLWWRPTDDIVCADTHGGNILVTESGMMVAIDVPVMRGLPFEGRNGL